MYDLNAIEKAVRRSIKDGATNLTREEFSERNDLGIEMVADNLDNETYSREIMGAVLGFMESTQLSTESIDPSTPLTGKEALFFSHNTDPDEGMITEGSALTQLCAACGVPTDKIPTAATSIASLVETYTKSDSADSISIALLSNAEDENIEAARENYMNTSAFIGDSFASVAQEVFGEHSNDARPALAVAIASVIDRTRNMVTDSVSHRIPTQSGIVRFDAQDDQVFRLDQYDVRQMTSNPIDTRESSVTRFIDMQHEPELANAELKRLVPKVSNDPDNQYLVGDGEIRFGARAPIMDLDLKGTNREADHFNHTDIIADSAFVESFTIELNDGTNAVPKLITASGLMGSHFRIGASMHRSTNRLSNIMHTIHIGRDEDGNAIEQAIPVDHVIEMTAHMDSYLDLKTGETHSQISLSFVPRRKGEGAVSADLITLCNALTTNSKGLHYTIDARWSELNMRKSDTVVRTYRHSYQIAIPTGSNLLHDFDVIRTAPEDMMSLITQFIAVHRDEKNIRKGKHRVGEIHDRMADEKEAGNVRHDRRYAQNYVVGHRIVPFAHYGSVKLMEASEHWNSGVKTFRTSDIRSDIRSFVDLFLSQMVAKCYSDSLYDSAISGRPNWVMVTSNIVCDLCLGVKHIHDQYNRQGEGWSRNSSGDLEKILDDGTTITVITVPWRSMAKQALMIPYVKGSKESNYSFWKNFDRGVFASQCKIANANAQWKRIFANASEDTVVTCPVGMLIDFPDLDQAFTQIADAKAPEQP